MIRGRSLVLACLLGVVAARADEVPKKEAPKPAAKAKQLSKQSLAGLKDVSLTPAQLQPYLGKYQLEGRTFEIVVSGGHLAIQLGGDKFDLVAQGNHEFAVAMSPRDRIVFTMLNGKATQMEMRQFGRPPIAIKRTE